MARFQYRLRNSLGCAVAGPQVSARTRRALWPDGALDDAVGGALGGVLRVADAGCRSDGHGDFGPDPDADLEACGPGWFESSWQLSHGLDVSEGDAALLLGYGLRRRPPPVEPMIAAVVSARVRGRPRSAPAAVVSAPFAAIDPFAAFAIDGLALV